MYTIYILLCTPFTARSRPHLPFSGLHLYYTIDRSCRSTIHLYDSPHYLEAVIDRCLHEVSKICSDGDDLGINVYGCRV